MHKLCARAIRYGCLAISLFAISWLSVGAQDEKKKQPPTPGPMLSQGTVDYETPEFTLTLVRSSQTVAALKPKGAGDFDFTPGDLLTERSKTAIFIWATLLCVYDRKLPRLEELSPPPWRALRSQLCLLHRHSGGCRSYAHLSGRLSLYRSREAGRSTQGNSCSDSS